jgi:lysozyme family protein
MSQFEKALEHVLQFEGGRVDHPGDRGGRTAYGITQRAYERYLLDYYPAASARQEADVWDIQDFEVEDIYRFYYWTGGRCEYLPTPLDFLHFDACVNHGVKNAGRIMQRAIGMGLKVDGIVGEKTLAAANNEDALEGVCYRYLLQRMKFYHAICERHRAQRVFLTGWIGRLVRLWKAAL